MASLDAQQNDPPPVPSKDAENAVFPIGTAILAATCIYWVTIYVILDTPVATGLLLYLTPGVAWAIFLALIKSQVRWPRSGRLRHLVLWSGMTTSIVTVLGMLLIAWTIFERGFTLFSFSDVAEHAPKTGRQARAILLVMFAPLLTLLISVSVLASAALLAARYTIRAWRAMYFIRIQWIHGAFLGEIENGSAVRLRHAHVLSILYDDKQQIIDRVSQPLPNSDLAPGERVTFKLPQSPKKYASFVIEFYSAAGNPIPYVDLEEEAFQRSLKP